jgi:hypothetical protein
VRIFQYLSTIGIAFFLLAGCGEAGSSSSQLVTELHSGKASDRSQAGTPVSSDLLDPDRPVDDPEPQPLESGLKGRVYLERFADYRPSRIGISMPLIIERVRPVESLDEGEEDKPDHGVVYPHVRVSSDVNGWFKAALPAGTYVLRHAPDSKYSIPPTPFAVKKGRFSYVEVLATLIPKMDSGIKGYVFTLEGNARAVSGVSMPLLITPILYSNYPDQRLDEPVSNSPSPASNEPVSNSPNPAGDEPVSNAPIPAGVKVHSNSRGYFAASLAPGVYLLRHAPESKYEISSTSFYVDKGRYTYVKAEATRVRRLESGVKGRIISIVQGRVSGVSMPLVIESPRHASRSESGLEPPSSGEPALRIESDENGYFAATLRPGKYVLRNAPDSRYEIAPTPFIVEKGEYTELKVQARLLNTLSGVKGYVFTVKTVNGKSIRVGVSMPLIAEHIGSQNDPTMQGKAGTGVRSPRVRIQSDRNGRFQAALPPGIYLIKNAPDSPYYFQERAFTIRKGEYTFIQGLVILFRQLAAGLY